MLESPERNLYMIRRTKIGVEKCEGAAGRRVCRYIRSTVLRLTVNHYLVAKEERERERERGIMRDITRKLCNIATLIATHLSGRRHGMRYKTRT